MGHLKHYAKTLPDLLLGITLIAVVAVVIFVGGGLNILQDWVLRRDRYREPWQWPEEMLGPF